MSWRQSADTRRILAVQALRAAAYGFGAVLLGVTLDERGWAPVRVGLVLTAVVAGTARRDWSWLAGATGGGGAAATSACT